jgi:hypothetical protein
VRERGRERERGIPTEREENSHRQTEMFPQTYRQTEVIPQTLAFMQIEKAFLQINNKR